MLSLSVRFVHAENEEIDRQHMWTFVCDTKSVLQWICKNHISNNPDFRLVSYLYGKKLHNVYNFLILVVL